jgi:hypothetical protein
MADDEDIAALVVDNGSGMCKGTFDLILSLSSRAIWNHSAHKATVSFQT